MVIQCNPFVATPPIFEIVGDPSPNPPPLVDAPDPEYDLRKFYFTNSWGGVVA